MENIKEETRVAVISIIVENKESISALNNILHEYSCYVIGRMGIPFLQNGVNIICFAIVAPQDKINALSGKLGKLSGISAKAVYSKV